ncbi:hypothetical protein IGI04_016455 [Brassica rapa subsp. trilocularis]|uniref:Uncharacterized protein n=1 Tax=Brassica rapa subsp. trilocularis TaxID=1813537 RepID=A0ABQ7MUA7_BRACM|nr:hypothetical protein IGI04_016455 [Brassica rapa subsp. trilocularis]
MSLSTTRFFFSQDIENDEEYFDADGNFVEYLIDKEVKFLGCCAEKHEDSGTVKPSDELSQEDIGFIKMRISKLFEPGTMDFASLFLLYCGLDRLICRDSDEKNTTGAEALQSDYVFDKTSGYVNFFSLGVYDGRLPPPGRCSLTFELNCFKRILPQSRTFPYTTFCLHTLLRQTYARSNPRFFFSFRLPYALLSLAKTVTPFNYTAQATVIGRH